MITMTDYPGTNVIEFLVDDGVSKEDFDLVAQRLETIIDTHGSVRMIEVIQKIGSVEPAALWADLKFGPSHVKYFTHVAVVADQKWIEWVTKMSQPFMKAQMRTFTLAQLPQAREWITQAPATPEV